MKPNSLEHKIMVEAALNIRDLLEVCLPENFECGQIHSRTGRCGYVKFMVIPDVNFGGGYMVVIKDGVINVYFGERHALPTAA